MSYDLNSEHHLAPTYCCTHHLHWLPVWSKESRRMAGLCKIKNAGDQLAGHLYFHPTLPYLGSGPVWDLWEKVIPLYAEISVWTSGFKIWLQGTSVHTQWSPPTSPCGGGGGEGSQRSNRPENCRWDCSFRLKKQLEVSFVAIKWTLKMHLWTEKRGETSSFPLTF